MKRWPHPLITSKVRDVKPSITRACRSGRLSRQPLKPVIVPSYQFQVTAAATSVPFLRLCLGQCLWRFMALRPIWDLPSLYVERFVRIPCNGLAALFRIDRAQFWARYTGFPSTADLIVGAVMLLVLWDCSDKCSTGYHDQLSTLVWARCLTCFTLALGWHPVALVLMT